MTPDLTPADIQRELRGLIEQICELNGGRKKVAGILSERLGYDVSVSKLSHALSLNPDERRRHAIRAEWLFVLTTLEGGRAIPQYLATLCGGEVVDYVPVSADEENLATNQILERYPMEVRQGFKAAREKQILANRAARRIRKGDSK